MSGSPPPVPPPEEMREIFRAMTLIRRFEERAAEEYMAGRVGGFLHLAIGEEAAIVGTVSALRPDDPLTSTYREHGQALARGTDPRAIMAELLGRATGICGGRGGSMHLMDIERSFYGGYGIVGGSVPLALGLAWAARYSGTDRVSVTMFGEGAAGQGVVSECFNMAGLWDLPIVFLILNNQYSMGTPVERAAAVEDFYPRAAAYDIESWKVDGMDVLAVRAALSEAARLARDERRPACVELLAYRYKGHSMSDPDTVRAAEEKERWKARDPLVTFERVLLGEGIIDADAIAAMQAEVDEVVDDATTFARESPEVPVSELADDVYAQPWNDDPRGSALMRP
ncbi:MAG: pyruvate dehydrogenase (acetyl-transferring) E1 component subunit alpha [Actinobacteria bacterium]|nr:pyruvate dehydrogenase (acetyl-transferring) E1 component subunit alpha [Actinomycetota bacterium]